MKKRIIVLILLLSLTLSSFAQIKIRDISKFAGADSKQLIGYGLIVGLDGTGDGGSSQITIQSIKNMMNRFGITVPTNSIRPNNVAAVMVTAELDAFAKPGSKLDVMVSSISDANSLEGGTLLMTQLFDENENAIAKAQGAISIGGFNQSSGGARIRKNHTLVGRIPNGGTVDKGNYSEILQNGELILTLNNSDFTTARRIAEKINAEFDKDISVAEDASSISILVEDRIVAEQSLVDFISTIENLTVNPQTRARIVINERTGTIVAGGNVKISQVAITHGNLVIEINSQEQAIQLGNVLQTSEQTTMTATAEQARMVIMEAPTVQDLAQTLNSIKVSPRDLISIFQSIKVSGALQAELVII